MTHPEQPGAAQIAAILKSVSGISRPDVLFRASSHPNAPVLTAGFPGRTSDQLAAALAGRLVWWPRGLCHRKKISVVSSRTGTRHHERRWWYDRVRTAVLRIDSQDECLLSVSGTATHDVVQRAAELFGIPLLTITVSEGQADHRKLAKWIVDRFRPATSAHHRVPAAPDSVVLQHVEVSPRLTEVRCTDDCGRFPLRDRLSLFTADRCCVCSCRRNGHLHRLILEILSEPPERRPVILLAGGQGTDSALQQTLTHQGAVSWLLEDAPRSGRLSNIQVSEPALSANRPVRHIEKNDRIPDVLRMPDQWLCHWTRPHQGCWPDQSESDRLDELLLGCASADRSALAALLRIISIRTILGSAVGPGRTAVSFTEVPLAEFRRHRVYRRHRRRYDFEPWGIAIRRSELEQQGAQPVTYICSSKTPRPDPERSLWHHPATDRSGRIDWTAEREWRVPGCVRLDHLPSAAVCVFVDTVQEAGVAAASSPWPVVVTPG